MDDSSPHKIYLVRHGQCRSNITGKKYLPEDDPLTNLGKRQSEALADYLKAVYFTQAYCSSYPRAVETATILLNKMDTLCPTELQKDDRIRERGLGDFVGRSTKDMSYFIYGELEKGVRFNDIEIPGGESVEEYIQRITTFFHDIFDSLYVSSTPQTVLIVSHGMLMCRFFAGLNDGTFADICNVANWSEKCLHSVTNTSCTTINVQFDSKNGKPVLFLEKLHDTKHLDNVKVGQVEEEYNPSLHLSTEERDELREKAAKIPGVKEDVPGCFQV